MYIFVLVIAKKKFISVQFVPVCEMSVREFGRVTLNVNEIHRRRSAALLANTLQKQNKTIYKMKVMPLIAVGRRIFSVKCTTLTNYKADCNIVRKSDSVTNCQQFFISNDRSHFLCKRPTYTESSTTSCEPKLSLMTDTLRGNTLECIELIGAIKNLIRVKMLHVFELNRKKNQQFTLFYTSNSIVCLLRSIWSPAVKRHSVFPSTTVKTNHIRLIAAEVARRSHNCHRQNDKTI